MKKGWVVLIITLLSAIFLSLPAGAAGSAMVQSTPVSTFPEWVNFYGINSTFDGEPLPVGSEVVAYAGTTRCGSFVVHMAGQYGLLPCYRDQPSQPGAQPGDAIRFTINGYEAILRGPDEAIWTVNGDRKNVELEAQGVPQSPTSTPTQTTLPTSTPAAGTGTVPPPPTDTPVAPPTSTPWVPPSPTATFWVPPPATSTTLPQATPLQAGYCRDAIVDGGFETGGGWVIDPAPRQASRSTAQVHSGAYAMRLGIADESNVSSPSAIRQRVEIPLDATYAMLSFYYYPIAEADPRSNYWEVLLFEPGTNSTVATLFRNNTGNERRWLLMNIDLLAYRGRTFDFYFNVFNDGQGGASALYLDDVVLQICTPTGATATHTPIAWTPIPTPVTPYPTPPGACQELIVNGDFEAGTQGWHLGRTERMGRIVAEPRHAGNQAMHLGFTEGTNVNTFSSIRQTVNIPADAISAAITFWTYPMSTATSGQDHQEFVILSPYDNSTLALPWRVYYDNGRVWTQQRVDLMEYRGRPIVVYFNAYNDGGGGSTALVVDEISLQACRNVPPTAIPLAVATTAPSGVAGTQLPDSGTPAEGIEYHGPDTATPAEGAGSQEIGAQTSTPEVVFAHPTPTPAPTPSPLSGINPGVVVVVAVVVAAGLVALFWWLRGRGGTKPPQATGGDAGGDAPIPPPGYQEEGTSDRWMSQDVNTSWNDPRMANTGEPKPLPSDWDDTWMDEPLPYEASPTNMEDLPLDEDMAPKTWNYSPQRSERPPVHSSSTPRGRVVSSVDAGATFRRVEPQDAEELPGESDEDFPFPGVDPPAVSADVPPAPDEDEPLPE